MNTVPVKLVDEGVNWPAWISAGAACLTLVIVAVTAWFAYRALQDARRARHGQLITELLRDWTEPAAVEAIGLHGRLSEADILALVDRLFDPNAKEPPTQDELDQWGRLVRVANLIEALGVLVSENAITAEVVYKMWGGAILTAWPKWDEAVKRLRGYDDEPDTFVYFEAVSLEVRRLSDAGKQAANEPSAATSASRAPLADVESEPGNGASHS